MNLITIYRAERLGAGPWSQQANPHGIKDDCRGHYISADLGLEDHFNSDRCPQPEADGDCCYYSLPSDYHCGFASLEQLQSWFPTAFRLALHEGGYILVQYETSQSYEVLNRQICFDPSVARVRLLRSLETLAPLVACPLPRHIPTVAYGHNHTEEVPF